MTANLYDGSTDIITVLKTPVKYVTIEGVDVLSHPCGAIEDILEEAANEIARLRQHIQDYQSVFGSDEVGVIIHSPGEAAALEAHLAYVEREGQP